MKKKVAVIMGSDSDLPVVKGAIGTLKSFGIPVEVHVMSAHRTPEQACAFARDARKNGFGAIIAAAGKAAHLAGVLAAHTTLPVIGIPIKSSTLDGLVPCSPRCRCPRASRLQLLPSTARTMRASLAAQMLALSDEEIAAQLDAMKEKMTQDVLAKDAAIQSAEF